jgi:hypothetical protein
MTGGWTDLAGEPSTYTGTVLRKRALINRSARSALARSPPGETAGWWQGPADTMGR